MRRLIIDEHPWVQEHGSGKWHLYPLQWGRAACGERTIPGSPLVSAVKPEWDTACVCTDCERVYDGCSEEVKEEKPMGCFTWWFLKNAVGIKS